MYPATVRLLLFFSGLIILLGSYYGVIDMLDYFQDSELAYGLLYLFLMIILSIFSLYMLIGSIALPLIDIENWIRKFTRPHRHPE